MREATPVNRSISSDQSHRMEIADDTMVTDLFTLCVHVFPQIAARLLRLVGLSHERGEVGDTPLRARHTSLYTPVYMPQCSAHMAAR